MQSSPSDEENGSERTNRQSSDSSGRRRLRRRMFFVLFQRAMAENRRRHRMSTDEESNDALAPATVVRPIRLISNAEEAEQLGATCRFCLETELVDSPFISPCACTGSAEFVHVACLRQWQLLNGVSNFCNVCTSQYSLPPPRLKENLVKKGSLLLFDNTDFDTSGSIFHESVVLMLNGGESMEPMGIIINKKSQSSLSLADLPPSSSQRFVQWRRGGPVCGGRFGVTKYMIAHNIRQPLLENSPLSSQEVIPGGTMCFEMASLDNVDGDSDEDSDDDFQQDPAIVMSPRQFHNKLRALAQTKVSVDIGDDCEQVNPTTSPTSAPSIIAFSGYCRWSKEQLKGEIMQGSWQICEGREQDICRELGEDNSLWQELMASDRLVHRNSWFEDFSTRCGN